MLGERGREYVYENAAGSAVGIETRIVDGHFKADRIAAVQCHSENGNQLARRKPVRQAEIDSGHDGIIEHINIEVDEEAVEPRASQMSNGAAGGILHTEAA